MIKHDEAKQGTHYWAQSVSGKQILIVLLDSYGSYQVCGAWECGIRDTEITLISEIPKPSGYEKRELYYY
jgi:hypothetical protein